MQTPEELTAFERVEEARLHTVISKMVNSLEDFLRLEASSYRVDQRTQIVVAAELCAKQLAGLDLATGSTECSDSVLEKLNAMRHALRTKVEAGPFGRLFPRRASK